MSLYRFRILIDNKIGKSFDSGFFKWMLKRCQIVEHTSHSPYIYRIGVKLMLYDFWSKIDGSSYSLREELRRIMDNFTHSKITKFNFTLFSEKDVL